MIVFFEGYYSYKFLLQFVYFLEMSLICISPYNIAIKNIGVDQGIVFCLMT